MNQLWLPAILPNNNMIMVFQDTKPLVQPEPLPAAAAEKTRRLVSKENNQDPKDILQAWQGAWVQEKLETLSIFGSW